MSRVSSPRPATKPAALCLKPMPVIAASMEAGKLYIWDREHIPMMDVVVLNEAKDGIRKSTDAEDESWYFAHNLVGQLYGPINLQP